MIHYQKTSPEMSIVNSLSIALLFLVLWMSSCGSPREARQFYREYKRHEGVTKATIPGWVIYIGSSFAHDIVKDEEARIALRFARKIKRLQFMSVENSLGIPPQAAESFVAGLRAKNYEDLIYVRDEETTINVMSRGKDDRLRHLIVLVNEEDEFVYCYVRTNIKARDIAKLARQLGEVRSWSGRKQEKIPPRKQRKRDREAPAPIEPQV
jgi:hypothetical protein